MKTKKKKSTRKTYKVTYRSPALSDHYVHANTLKEAKKKAMRKITLERQTDY